MAKTVAISSDNDIFQQIEVLKRNREKRTKAGKLFVEGVNSIDRLVAHGWTIESFVYAGKRRLSSWAVNHLDNTPAAFHYALSEELMKKVSEKEETSELIAIAKQRTVELGEIKLGPKLLVVVVDRPSNAGNLGTIIRSCDSFGVDAIIVSGHGVDVYDPVTIRSSIGSLFAIPIVKLESMESLSAWFSTAREKCPGFQIIGTSANTEEVIDDMDFARPTVLLFGNETTGLGRNFKAISEHLVKIPIYGSATSLNVACATSVCLYEVGRQRRLKGPGL